MLLQIASRSNVQSDLQRPAVPRGRHPRRPRSCLDRWSRSHHQKKWEEFTGGSLQESREALAIAETDGRLFCTVGVHPTRCKEFEESSDPEGHFQALVSLAKEGVQKGKVVAVGECGLDYDRLQFCPSDIQRKYFEKHFELAEALKLPMFLHLRAAAEDFCNILNQQKGRA